MLLLTQQSTDGLNQVDTAWEDVAVPQDTTTVEQWKSRLTSHGICGVFRAVEADEGGNDARVVRFHVYEDTSYASRNLPTE